MKIEKLMIDKAKTLKFPVWCEELFDPPVEYNDGDKAKLSAAKQAHCVKIAGKWYEANFTFNLEWQHVKYEIDQLDQFMKQGAY
jgi:hypothetical protein